MEEGAKLHGTFTETKLMQAIKYRIRYWWRKFVTTIGLCPDCGTVVNRTRYGRAHCPSCGKMK